MPYNYDRTAAKDPQVTAINRRLRKVKSEAVKYMQKAVPDRHWDAGNTYDYIGLGSSFILFGNVAPGEYRNQVRIELQFVPGREHNGDDPGSVNISVLVHAGGRQIDGYREKGTQVADMARNISKVLQKGAKNLASNLKGDTDREKQQMLGKVEDALKQLPELEKNLEELKKLISESKNISLDAAEIASAARKVSGSDITWGMRSIYELADKMAR